MATFVDFFYSLFPTPDEGAELLARIDVIERLLGEIRDEVPKLAWPVEGVSAFGSSTRGTAIRPLQEVDIAWVFRTPPIGVVMRSYSPDELVGSIADALSQRSASVRAWSGEAVTLSSGGGVRVDIFPAFMDVAMGRNVMYFPRQDTQWFRSNPIALDRLFLARNAEVGGKLIPTALLLKAWNKKHDGAIPSWMLDTVLLYNAARLTDHHSVDCYFFLDAIANAFERIFDVVSADGFYDLRRTLDPAVAGAIVLAAREDLDVARLAVDAEAAGDDDAAVAHWRQVFGTGFPDVPPNRTSPGVELRPRSALIDFVREQIGADSTEAKLGSQAPRLKHAEARNMNPN